MPLDSPKPQNGSSSASRGSQPASPFDRQSKDYLDALDFLHERLNYEKTSDQPYTQQHYRLNRMRELLELLGGPHLGPRVIHIAGTKGKGSVAWMMAEALRLSGHSTGLYTSPHLLFLEERFVVDGSPCAPSELVGYVDQLRPAVLELAKGELGAPTFFELTTALAWLHFQAKKVEYVVLEVGLGGRLDSTNVCSPCLTIITSISLDHQQQLGDTIGRIAGEKAGIIKPGIPVVSGATASEARAVIDHVALQNNATLYELERDFGCSWRTEPSIENQDVNSAHPSPKALQGKMDFDWKPGLGYWGQSRKGLRLRMLGPHQSKNAALVCAASDVLNRMFSIGSQPISESALTQSLSDTQVPARMEIRGIQPHLILDSAHNPASIEAMISTLRIHFQPERRILVFAASRDKDYGAMLHLLTGYFDAIFLTQFHSNPRAVSVEQLGSVCYDLLAKIDGTRPAVFLDPNPVNALSAARNMASPRDLLCIAGSFFLASELMSVLS